MSIDPWFDGRVQAMPFGCIEWTAHRMPPPDGYGRARYEGKMQLAHRVAWTLNHGPIPDGLFVLHRCDNPPCCNPDHLFLGTQADNVRDRDEKGRHGRPYAKRTHCPAGHAYDEANTYRTNKGHRLCCACLRLRNAERYRRRAQLIGV